MTRRRRERGRWWPRTGVPAFKYGNELCFAVDFEPDWMVRVQTTELVQVHSTELSVFWWTWPHALRPMNADGRAVIAIMKAANK